MSMNETSDTTAAGRVTGVIVVGVDGSDDGRRALDWAIDEALRTGKRLRLVHGVELSFAAASPYGTGYVIEQLEESGQSVLAEAAKVAGDRGVQADTHMEIGSSAYALIEASREADLLVVGSRGHGGFTGMLLGSVSTACVHHAHCPVVVVRREERKAA